MIFICFTTVLLPDSPAPGANQEEKGMCDSTAFKGRQYIERWVSNYYSMIKIPLVVTENTTVKRKRNPLKKPTMGKDGFRGCGFPSRGQDHGSVFGAVVCKIQARKYYIKSLPLVPQDKSCFCLGERSTVQLAFDHMFAFQKYGA